MKVTIEVKAEGMAIREILRAVIDNLAPMPSSRGPGVALAVSGLLCDEPLYDDDGDELPATWSIWVSQAKNAGEGDR